METDGTYRNFNERDLTNVPSVRSLSSIFQENRVDFKEENKMATKGKILVLVSSGRGLPLKDGKVYTAMQTVLWRLPTSRKLRTITTSTSRRRHGTS